MRRLAILSVFAFWVAVTSLPGQTRVRVSQESAPGAADFDENILGVIDVFDQSTLTAAEVYQFDGPIGNSYNGSITPAISNTSQLFFVDTIEGLMLFVLHDEPDSDGGQVQMQFELFGDPDGAARVVEDDLSDTFRPGNTFGPFSFQTHHWWNATLAGTTTDGVVIGALEGPWSLLVGFTDVDGNPGNEMLGLTNWIATSVPGDPVPLALAVDQRVLLEAIEEASLDVLFEIISGNGSQPINCNNDQSVIKLAILTTPTFDATAVDHTTVNLDGAYESHADAKTGLARRHEKDIDHDGDVDLLFHFRFGETELTCDSTEATLTGYLFDGTEFTSTSQVKMREGPRVIKVK